jgi:tight adherence protein C
MREVERKAAGLSPKLTIPMVLFFMPVLIAILVVPTLIKIWGWNLSKNHYSIFAAA